MAGRLVLLYSIFAVAAFESACKPKSNIDRPPRPDTDQQELFSLPVDPGEVVMANRPVPLDVRAPCVETIMQGIGRYADVGWVSPRFFIVRSTNDQTGYLFTNLNSGGARFTARFRVPRSEEQAIALYGANQERGLKSVLFCDIPGTLPTLEGSGIRRLASWPIESVMAVVNLGGREREFRLDLGPDWNSGRELSANIDLSKAEVQQLQQKLTSTLGAQIIFTVSSRVRQTGCLQVIDLSGIDTVANFALRDGETGTVPLAKIKAAVSSFVSRNTSVHIVSEECGQEDIMLPPSAKDNATSFSCRRSGDSLQCRFEGQFSETPFNLQTNVIIGEGLRR